MKLQRTKRKIDKAAKVYDGYISGGLISSGAKKLKTVSFKTKSGKNVTFKKKK